MPWSTSPCCAQRFPIALTFSYPDASSFRHSPRSLRAPRRSCPHLVCLVDVVFHAGEREREGGHLTPPASVRQRWSIAATPLRSWGDYDHLIKLLLDHLIKLLLVGDNDAMRTPSLLTCLVSPFDPSRSLASRSFALPPCVLMSSLPSSLGQRPPPRPLHSTPPTPRPLAQPQQLQIEGLTYSVGSLSSSPTPTSSN